MDRGKASLMREIAAFEKQLDCRSRQAKESAISAKDQKIIADLDGIIAELEKEACGEMSYDEMSYMEDDMDYDIVEDDIVEDDMDYMEDDMDYMEDDMEDDMDYMTYMEDDYNDVEVFAGAEEDVTEDHWSEVQNLTDNTDLSDATETNQVASLKEASARLDRLASYIENGVKNGENKEWLKVALAIDKVADAIDIQIEETN
jgi:hypothetical protein